MAKCALVEMSDDTQSSCSSPCSQKTERPEREYVCNQSRLINLCSTIHQRKRYRTYLEKTSSFKKTSNVHAGLDLDLDQCSGCVSFSLDAPRMRGRGLQVSVADFASLAAVAEGKASETK